MIPVYNGADFLRQAVDSALNQTYPALEVIVVNDGSTDGGKTEEIAGSFGSRIRYVQRQNGGVAAALNNGIQVMEGSFFSWLSHDDLYYPHKIEFQMSFLRDVLHDAVMLYTDFDLVDANSRSLGVCRVPSALSANPLAAIASTIVHGCSTLISRQIFDRVGLFDERLRTTQDNDMWLRIYWAGFPVLHVPEILIRSRCHEGQGQRKSAQLNKQEKGTIFKKVARKLRDDPAQRGDFLNSIIRSDTRLPFPFLWTLCSQHPIIRPSGWMRYLCRRLLKSLLWRIQGKGNISA